MLKDKTIILGVTGSIAAYKIATLASSLVKLGANVHVIMTKNACNFINPITFETLTGNRTLVDTFDRNFEFDVAHVSLAKLADIMLIAPASANIIGKLAGGIADDMLTTTAMACRCKKIVSPAMNTGMYENPILQDNLLKLKKFGYKILEPAIGYLACGDTGAGKMPEPETLLEHIIMECACEKDFAGEKFIVTSGATIEPIDPVRYITNHSTGKMGCSIARAALMRGAGVKYICTPTAVRPDATIEGLEIVEVETAAQLKKATEEKLEESDVLVMAAAVADYRPKTFTDHKIKKQEGESTLELVRTDDILASLSNIKREGQIFCGFSMETENLLENSQKKLKKKKLDMIAANNLNVEGAGFAHDTNVLTLISKNSSVELPLMSKDEAAQRILDSIKELQERRDD